MNPLGTRSRVQEFARLLDGAVSGPTTLTAGQAALATRLRKVAPGLDAKAVPRAEFRASLRTRLVAVATVQAATLADAPVQATRALESALTWTQTRKAQRRLGVTAGAMASVVAFTGVGIAASRSLPGQPFYGLKLGAEDVQLRFVSGDTAKGSKHLEFAATRLREVTALTHGDGAVALGSLSGDPVAGGLAASGSTQRRINETLAKFNTETKSGRALLVHAYRTKGASEPLRILQTFSTTQRTSLIALLPDLPAGSKADGEASLQLVTDVSSTVNQLLSIGTCGGSCFPQAGGPTLPTEPAPSPGATASPSGGSQDNNVPPCTCVTTEPTPEPTPAVEPTASSGPTNGPTANPTDSPTSTPAPSASPSSRVPLPVPTDVLPTALPTTLPTLPPLPIPPVPSLPPLSSVLPSLPPIP